MYFSDAKYDAIGMIPRERLKTTSLYSAPVLWMELVMDGRNVKAKLLLTRLQRSAYKSVQKHRVHSFFAEYDWVQV